MPPVIRIENLSKSYRIAHGKPRGPYRTLQETITDGATWPLRKLQGKTKGSVEEFWALNDVNLEIEQGEVVGFIGRNGAGKSTLLKILSRITSPTRGRVELHGRVGSLLEVGTGFHPELTGRENVFLNGSILGMGRREIERKFDEIVDFSGVEKFLDTPVKRYSSGMYVRLAFAVAAHLEPEILIVDEVLAVGDAEFQKKCLGKMGDVAKAGRTVLFVSHNMAAVSELCSRTIILQSGKVAADGSTTSTLPEYLADALSSGNGLFDVTLHRARAINQRPIITHLRLMNGTGETTTDFFPDDSFVVEMALDPLSPIKSPRAAISIEDNLGRRITTAASYFQDSPIQSIGSRAVLTCVLKRLNLGVGRYLLSASIADQYHGLIDSLHCAVWFDVAWRNNYGNGEKYQPIYGPVLIDSFWSCGSAATTYGVLSAESTSRLLYSETGAQ